MEMKRAWATMEIKSIADDPDGEMILEGIASTPSTDRMGDIVEPMGAEFKLPMPFLWQHNSHEPIGTVTFAKPNKQGIPFKATIARKGVTKFIDDARALIKEGLVRGVSIGFVPKESEPMNPKEPWGALRFLKWLWLELSAVTIAANQDASITAIKAVDLSMLAASGRGHGEGPAVVTIQPPGASGSSIPLKGSKVNTQEMITGLEAKRAATAAAMQTLVEASNESGSTFTEDQKTQYAEHKNTLTQIDDQLVVLRDHEKLLLKTATPILPTTGTSVAPSKVPVGEGVVRANPNLPKGIGLARYAKALAWGRINMSDPIAYAEKTWADMPEVAIAMKVAVAAGTTTDSTWASPLVYANNLASEFLDYLRPQTIIGKIANLRRVPFNIRYPIQNGGSTVAWVGQGAPKPVSKLSFTSASLGFSKAAGIVVITQELARFSSPAAELVVRDDMAAQMVYFLDQQFIDPSIAAVANVSPASILNGASNVRQAAAVWSSMANVLTDVKVFLNTFATNEISLDGMYWIMTPDAALTLSLLLNTGGTAFAFPELSITGGTFLGIPVIVSNSVPHSVSAGSIVALVKGSEVFLADDGGINITVSGEASLNMDTAPTNNSATPTATSVVSMFQTDSIAIRAERFINWAPRRAYGVGYIDNMHTS